MWTLGKMALVLAELALLFGGLSLLSRSGRVPAELIRKMLHVAMGLTVVGFPWLFTEDWPVLVLVGLSLVGLVLLRVSRWLRRLFGGVLGGVGRSSLGDLCFPVSVGVLWLIADGDALLFGVPILVLTLADATAALIGTRYGSVHYQTRDGTKSVEGSLAFFVVTFMSVHVPVLLITDTDRLVCLLLGVTIGVLVMLLESVSWRGLDNVLVPLGTFLALEMYLDASATDLGLRAIAVVTMAGLTLAWRRRSSMDDTALILAALFGYAALMQGGWAWLLPPLALFLFHSIRWPAAEHPALHSVGALLSTLAVGIACLILNTLRPGDVWLLCYTAGFAAHFAIVGVAYSWRPPAERSVLQRLSDVVWMSLLAWALVVLPVILSVSPFGEYGQMVWFGVVCFVGAVASAGVFQSLMPRLYAPSARAGLVQWSALGLAGACALAVWAAASYLPSV